MKMKLIGFSFKKISLERIADSLKGLKINSKIDVNDMQEIKNDFMEKGQDVVRINFTYDINYEPNIAKIQLKGQILLAIPDNDAKELLNDWKKKKIKEDFRITIFNIILRKTNVKALELEEDMNLPFHINFPMLRKKQSKKQD